MLLLFKDKCFGCYGSDLDEVCGEFLLVSCEDMLNGGELGELFFIFGDFGNSFLY